MLIYPSSWNKWLLTDKEISIFVDLSFRNDGSSRFVDFDLVTSIAGVWNLSNEKMQVVDNLKSHGESGSWFKSISNYFPTSFSNQLFLGNCI